MFSNSLRRNRISVASLQKAGTLAISKPFASPNSLLELANPLLSPCLHLAYTLPKACEKYNVPFAKKIMVQSATSIKSFSYLCNDI